MAAGMRSGEEMTGIQMENRPSTPSAASEIKGTGENAQGARERGVIKVAV